MLNAVLVVWIAVSVSAFFIQDASVFYGMAVVAGLGLGSVQAASRSFMASLIPDGKEAEMFGFYALCGRSSSVLGPTLFGYLVVVNGGNQRPGFLMLTVLFAFGLLRTRAGRVAPVGLPPFQCAVPSATSRWAHSTSIGASTGLMVAMERPRSVTSRRVPARTRFR